MEKQLKDYLHLYLGCDVKCGIITIAKLTADLTDNEHISLWSVLANPNYKLILRPLSGMTEDEFIEAINLTAPDSVEIKPDAEDYDLELFYNDGGNMVDEDVAIGANVSCICYEGQIVFRKDGSIHCFDEDGKRENIYNMPKVYMYLLSKSFDLFGLINANLVMGKEKIVA